MCNSWIELIHLTSHFNEQVRSTTDWLQNKDLTGWLVSVSKGREHCKQREIIRDELYQQPTSLDKYSNDIKIRYYVITESFFPDKVTQAKDFQYKQEMFTLSASLTKESISYELYRY